MKKTILVLMLLVFGFANAQKVDVYNSKGELLTPKPIEKEIVPEFLKDKPDGMYKLKQVTKPVLVDGKFLFRVCWYQKNEVELISA